MWSLERFEEDSSFDQKSSLPMSYIFGWMAMLTSTITIYSTTPTHMSLNKWQCIYKKLLNDSNFGPAACLIRTSLKTTLARLSLLFKLNDTDVFQTGATCHTTDATMNLLQLPFKNISYLSKSWRDLVTKVDSIRYFLPGLPKVVGLYQ